MLVHLRLAVSVPSERELVHRLRIVGLRRMLLQVRWVGLLPSAGEPHAEGMS